MAGRDSPADAPPLTTQRVNRAFEVDLPATLPAGERLRLHGRSWSGAGAIRRVEVRVDGPGGAGPWREAAPAGPNRPHARVRWSVPWPSAAPGAYSLLARATDSNGTTQAESVPFNANGYQFS